MSLRISISDGLCTCLRWSLKRLEEDTRCFGEVKWCCGTQQEFDIQLRERDRGDCVFQKDEAETHFNGMMPICEEWG